MAHAAATHDHADDIKCIKPHKTEQQVGWLRSVLIQGLQIRRGTAAPAFAPFWVVDAGSVLCADIIASSVGSGEVMPGGQPAHCTQHGQWTQSTPAKTSSSR